MKKRVKRRRFNFKKFLKFLLFLCIIITSYTLLSKVPIKHIIVKGNNILSDETIIEASKLDDYPPFIKSLSSSSEKKIKKLPLVKEAKVKKKWGFIIEINITEYKVLFQVRSTNEYILDTKEKLVIDEINKGIPILINYVPDEKLDKMIEKFSLLDDGVLQKISEIEYSPTNFDSERYLFYMNDGNEVYITLNKIKEFNNYTKIKQKIGNKKGILYLDSGSYFDIKE